MSTNRIFITTVAICIFAVGIVFLHTAAVAEQAQYGTPKEARAMLVKVISALKADKEKALDMFNKGVGGFKDRDLQPFCAQVTDAKIVATIEPRLLGTDVKKLQDSTGKRFGVEIMRGAVEGRIAEVSYLFPRPGETIPHPKVSYVTRIGDLVCGVGYYE